MGLLFISEYKLCSHFIYTIDCDPGLLPLNGIYQISWILRFHGPILILFLINSNISLVSYYPRAIWLPKAARKIIGTKILLEKYKSKVHIGLTSTFKTIMDSTLRLGLSHLSFNSIVKIMLTLSIKTYCVMSELK